MVIFEQAASAKRRKVFFSFHYADIMRVNNVRKSEEFKNGRGIEGFYDRSLWESRKSQGDLARMIREGVQNTSAVCVLAGTNTWRRPWVKYEIARSVIGGKGLLVVHINRINSHLRPFGPDELGDNPCRYLGIAQRKSTGLYYLCERVCVDGNYKWDWYGVYTKPVDVPKYMPAPHQGHPLRLSQYIPEYDYNDGGNRNIGSWIDRAAVAAGY